MARYESIIDLIGDTPLVDISRLSPNPRVAILTKLEGANPGGSVKDRAAKAMVEEARRRWGRVDILHYNVGVSIAGGDAPLDEFTEAAFDRIDARRPAELLRSNLLRPVYHGKHGLRTLRV